MDPRLNYMEGDSVLSLACTTRDTRPHDAKVFSEAHNNASTVFKLHADYPEPLTGFQRRLFLKHVAQHVRKYNVIHHSTQAVRRGYESLQSLVSRLQSERAEIEEYLNNKAIDNAKDSVRDQEAAKDSETRQSEQTKRLKVEVEEGDSVALPVSTPNKPPARRGAGGLLRSAAFANMQKVLRSAQKEGVEHCAAVAQQRERIAKQTRLSLLQDDLANQEKLMEPLGQKLTKCDALEKETKSTLVLLLELWQEMFRWEAQYAASFSLRAAGPPGSSSDQSTLHPWQGKGSNDGGTNRGEAGKDNFAGVVLEEPTAIRVSAAYEIPFIPALFTPEAEHIVRSQVEEVLDGYLAYRTRMDPILKGIEEATREHHAQRAKQLMEVIGIGPSEGRDMIDLGFAPGTDAVSGGIAGLPDTGSSNDAAVNLRNLIKSPFGISDESGSDDSGDEALAKERFDGVPASGESHDQLERHKIQSALSALDDFEEIY